MTLCARIVSGQLLNMSATSKGWITARWRWHPQRFRTIKICPKDTVYRLAAQSTRNGGISLATQGARHERHDLEGGPGEAGLDAVFGHRMGGGLCNRDHPACA